MDNQIAGPTDVRDLSDFVAKWDVIRLTLSADVIDGSHLPPQAQDTIKWLRILADRVCALPADSGL